MRLAALLSGGKDSVFTIYKCVQAGHDLSCVVNLTSPAADGSELDSYCFQTVGDNLISGIADCLNVPLVQGTIRGSAINQNLDYGITKGDEVEDLYNVLLQAKTLHNVEAVCAGALFSTYQKLRVESVCDRLGLACICPIWETDQLELLHQMKAVGLEAIMIKVACLGLDRRHLGKSVTEQLPMLQELTSKYAINPAGEGGEYESLTLFCPGIYRKRLVVEESEVVTHSDDFGAPVYYLKVLKWRTE
ncbi:hypothetical protein RCL1_008671 [Eukaryota sp. TZLM3-RCL]